MKIIITENQVEFIRRYKKIKELVDEGIDVLSNDEDFCCFNYSAFIEEVCWQVSDKMEYLNLHRYIHCGPSRQCNRFWKISGEAQSRDWFVMDG